MTATRLDFPTIELVRFLLARVDDDEQALRKRVRKNRGSGDGDTNASFVQSRMDIAVKRQVLGQVQHLLVLRDLPSEQIVRDLATHILRSMAEPYDGHVQFRDEWRVERGDRSDDPPGG